MAEFPDRDSKSAIIEMHQQTVANPLQTNEKLQQGNRNPKQTNYRPGKFDNQNRNLTWEGASVDWR